MIYFDFLFQFVKILNLTFSSFRFLFQYLSIFQINEFIIYLNKKKKNIKNDNMFRKYFVQSFRCCEMNLRKCNYVKFNNSKKKRESIILQMFHL